MRQCHWSKQEHYFPHETISRDRLEIGSDTIDKIELSRLNQSQVQRNLIKFHYSIDMPTADSDQGPAAPDAQSAFLPCWAGAMADQHHISPILDASVKRSKRRIHHETPSPLNRRIRSIP